VKILVAKTNLDHGAAIKEPKDMFVEKTFNQEDAPKDGLTEFKILKNKFLKNSLRKNDHITIEDLMDERASILARLPDGYQAYGIQVDPASIAGGWASVPGSKVNILWTRRSSDDKTSFTRVLLEDVLVLAADQGSKVIEDGKAMPASVVTVALKTEDTMKVKLAQQYGPLTLTLRKFGDTTPGPESEGVNGEELFSGKLESKNRKKLKTTELPDELGGGEPLQGDVVPQITGRKDDKAVAVPPPQRKIFHVVTIRQGDKQTRQVIEIDANGNPVQDDVQQAAPEVPPAVGAPPEAPQAAAPAGKKDEK